MKVSFLDLHGQYEQIKAEVELALKEVLESCAFAGGIFVHQFENEFAKFCECDHAIGVGSGTEALWLALIAVGVKPGDEVITVSNTFIATVEAICYCGAKPVFVDIDKNTHTIDPGKIEAAITGRTRAIIPVHLYGQSAHMDPIIEIAKRRDLIIIEDACQAHGATYLGQKAGTLGAAGCFSFYPGKNLGAYGEGGAVVTNNPEIAANIKRLRDHGQEKKYHHALIGWNSRMDGFQGAVLNLKLKYLESWNDSRKRHAELYTQLLSETEGVVTPVEAEGNEHVFHLYVIRVKNRSFIQERLAKSGIDTAIHYPIPIHLQQAYRELGLASPKLPVTEQYAGEILSLPMYPELTKDKIQFVAKTINESLR